LCEDFVGDTITKMISTWYWKYIYIFW